MPSLLLIILCMVDTLETLMVMYIFNNHSGSQFYLNIPPNTGNSVSLPKEIEVKQTGTHSFDSMKPTINVEKEPEEAPI